MVYVALVVVVVVVAVVDDDEEEEEKCVDELAAGHRSDCID